MEFPFGSGTNWTGERQLLVWRERERGGRAQIFFLLGNVGRGPDEHMTTWDESVYLCSTWFSTLSRNGDWREKDLGVGTG